MLAILWKGYRNSPHIATLCSDNYCISYDIFHVRRKRKRFYDDVDWDKHYESIRRAIDEIESDEDDEGD